MDKKQKKMSQPVRGTKDFLPQDCEKYNLVVDEAANISKLYGFGQIATPIFEFSQTFSGVGATSDIITKETYTFEDRNGESLTLRPEGTACIVRALISNGMHHEMPLKLVYNGPMFRYDRPQKGRYRQFHQFGVEAFGIASPDIDGETILMAHDILKKLQIRDKTILKINTLGDLESRSAYRQTLLEYLEKYKNDLSDYSKIRMGKNPLRVLDSKESQDQEIISNAPSYKDHINKESREFFAAVIKFLELFNIDFIWDDKLVRGLDYYCHSVFEFTTEALGSQSAVLAGGRYDGLVKSMGGPDIQGVGWAFGIERLMLLRDHLNLVNTNDNKIKVIFIGVDEKAQNLSYQLASNLRLNDIVSEVIYSGSFGKKMKKAGKSKATFAIIIGEDEIKNDSLTIKNLVTGKQETIAKQSLVTYLREQNNESK